MYTVKPSLYEDLYRYMGARSSERPPELKELTALAVERVSAAAKPLACKRIVSVDGIRDGCIRYADTRVGSRDLAAHLQRCEQVVLFAATLGCDVDRLIERDGLLQPSLAVAEQAAAAVLIEQYADECCESIQTELRDTQFLTPRFSPGYGDCPLTAQEALLRHLDAHKRIGLALTDSFMMTPMKSVSGWLGVTSDKKLCFSKSCAMCNNRHCAFRKAEDNL